MTETKACRDCSLELPLHRFSRCRGYRDGLQHKCKACDARKGVARRSGTPYVPINPHPTRTRGTPKAHQRGAPASTSQADTNAAPEAPPEVTTTVPEVPPEVPLQVPLRAPGPVRLVTEYDFVRILAANIETLAKELQDIADIAVQDGRAISSTSDSAFDMELQDIERRFSTLVAGRANALGLVATD